MRKLWSWQCGWTACSSRAGSSMVTTNTLASMDEDDDSALKRFNIILKVRKLCLTC